MLKNKKFIKVLNMTLICVMLFVSMGAYSGEVVESLNIEQEYVVQKELIESSISEVAVGGVYTFEEYLQEDGILMKYSYSVIEIEDEYNGEYIVGSSSTFVEYYYYHYDQLVVHELFRGDITLNYRFNHVQLATTYARNYRLDSVEGQFTEDYGTYITTVWMEATGRGLTINSDGSSSVYAEEEYDTWLTLDSSGKFYEDTDFVYYRYNANSSGAIFVDFYVSAINYSTGESVLTNELITVAIPVLN
ncbi:MAG: hypothetical protein R3Y45_08505 [Bacillota bacterium]